MLLRSLVNQWLRQAAQQRLHDALAHAAHGSTDPEQRVGEGPPAPCDVAIVFGLSVEAGGLVDRLQHLVTTRYQTHAQHAGTLDNRQIVIVEAGVGRQAAAAVTREVLAWHQPASVISTGFAAALQPDMRRGHVLLADQVRGPDGQELALDLPLDRTAAGRTKSLHLGRLLTVDHVVRSQKEKRALGEEHAALACDMETIGVALACRDLGTRFLAVRIISDVLDEELPREIESMLNQTTFAGKLGAATGAIFRRPSSVKDMWQLKEVALEASDRLARFLTGVVAQLPTAQPRP